MNVDLSKILLALVAYMYAHRVRMFNRVYVPAWYELSYHSSDRGEIEDLEPFLLKQAKEALDDGLARLNQPSWREKLSPQWFPRLPVERTQDFWRVDLLPDPNVPPGKLEIHHRVRVGTETARSGDRTEVVMQMPETSTSTVVTGGAVENSKAYAVLTCETADGAQVWRMAKQEVAIGRGGLTDWVDLKIAAGEEVSRVHFRLRAVRPGQLELRDESANGTTVNGGPAPKQSWMALALPAVVQLPGKVRIQVAEVNA